MALVKNAVDAAWKLEQFSVALAMDPVALVRSLRVQRKERELDRALGVRTSSRSFLASPSHFSDATPSQPLGYAALQCVESDIVERGTPLRSLIDLGCGRGRALVYLSKLSFGTVLGVEVDAELAAAARENVLSLETAWSRAKRLTIIEADAVDVELEWIGSVILLFNPFGAQTLSAVLKKVRVSLAESAGVAHVYYAVPIHHRVFREVFPQVTACAIRCQETVIYYYRLGP